VVPDLEHIGIAEDAACDERLKHVTLRVSRENRAEAGLLDQKNDACLVGGSIYRRNSRPQHLDGHATNSQPLPGSNFVYALRAHERPRRVQCGRLRASGAERDEHLAYPHDPGQSSQSSVVIRMKVRDDDSVQAPHAGPC